MSNSIPYLVKKGDTLQSIANELGIDNPRDLRHYHNMNAEIMDGIGPEAPVGKTLLTPPQNEIETINAKNEERQQVVTAAREKEEEQKQQVKEKEQQKQAEEKEKQKEAEKNAHDDKYFVVHGALCCCNKAENPKQTAKLLVTSHNKVIYNAEEGKFSATDADKTFDPAAATFGKCTLKPSSGGYLPCAMAPTPKWEKVYEKTSIKGNKLLTEISTLQCTVGGKIEVVKSGQTDTIMKEHAENTNPAALALINPAIKMPVLKTAYPSVSNITLKSLKNTPDFKSVSSTDTKSVEKVTIRQNEECSFLAKIKTGNVNLTSWIIYDGFTDDKDKRLFTEEQLGTSFKYTFSVLGKYRVEGYGKPKKEDFEGGKYNKNYPDCSIDVEVVVNKLDGTELVPIDGENFARMIKGKMRLRQNFPASFKAKFLMPPTADELENLKMYVTDALGNVLKSTRIENTVSFTPTNSKAQYKITAIYKLDEGETQTQSFTGETIANSVAEITHDAAVIRPGTPMTFSAKKTEFSLYVPDEQEAIAKEVNTIKWNLNGRLMGNGRNITIPGSEFINLGKYVVEAYVTLANAYGQNAKHEDDDWHFEVKENDVISFSYTGVPKVGKTTFLEADHLVFPDLTANETIVWDTAMPHKTTDKKTISIKPFKAGKEIVKCRINRQPGKTLSIDVKQAKVLGMMFTDSNGIEIEKSSWYQTVNIWVKQEHLIGEEIAIEIWDNVKGYCKVINVPKYDGNLVPLTLDSYIKSKAGDWAKLYVKIGAPKLKLANPNYIFEAKNILDVEDKREIYSAQMGTQDAKQRHYHVDYNQVSYFYGKSRGIKAGEKLTITIYEKGKMLFEVKSPDVLVDTSGAIKAKLQWDRIAQKTPSRTVYAVVQDSEDVILYNGAKTPNGGVAITKKSALLGLAEYKSAVLVKKSEKKGLNNGKNCEKLHWGNRFSCEERKKIIEIASRLNCNPNYLTSAMALETGGKFNPSLVNSLGYVGLIQIGHDAALDINRRKKTAITAGSSGSLCKMSIMEQLTYVEYYLEPFKGKLKTLADFYLAILMPVDCGKGHQRNHIVFDNNLVLDYDINGKEVKNTKWVRKKGYLANPSFIKETNEDGKTYVWEIAEVIESWYKKGKNQQHECKLDCSFKNNLESNSKWNDPVDNPEIALFNFYGDYKPQGSSFGLVRNNGTKAHQGLDIFAPKGTPVKACLKGTIVYVSHNAGDFGKFIVLEVSKKELDDSRQDYIFKYTGEIEKGDDFGDSDKRYLRYGHLSEILVTNNQIVEAGKIIGKSGNTGNASNQNIKARHLHFEVTDAITAGRGLINRENPAYYVRLNKADKDKQEKNED